MSAERTCADCKFALMEDYGWSNWTVEGTQFHCLKRLHPEREGFDRWYGEEKRLLFAVECPGFAKGDSINVDVDQDEAPYNSPDPWWTFYIPDDERRVLMAAFSEERGGSRS